MDRKKILLLNGSPRKKGTSFSFAQTIKVLSEDAGHKATIEHIINIYKEQKSFDDLIEAIGESDIIAIISPLYVDTLPYPAIWLFEKLADEHKEVLHNKHFFAVGQSGFIDIKVLQPLLNSCRHFGEEAGMKWLGGLAYGGGAVLNGAKLEDLGKKGQRITLAFKLALQDVLEGNNISPKAQETLTERIPKLLYRPIATYLNHSAKQTAKEKGITIEELCKKTYLE